MLKYLEIRNFVLIDKLKINFNNGFNVLTGETGAGKSIIISALELITGEKGSIRMVGSNGDRLIVMGCFSLQSSSNIVKNKLKEWNVQAIIPVPMYKDKEIKRGYNQAEVFGRALSKETGIALDDKCIIRKKSTVPQKKLSNEMRKINLQKAFGVDRKICSEYKTVLLVDDIYTTGSTFDACAKVLKVAGVEKVYCLSVAVGRDG